VNVFDQINAIDRSIFTWINMEWSCTFFDHFFGVWTHLGGAASGFLFLIIVLLITRSVWAFVYAGMAYGMNAALFEGVKYTVLRQRPYLLPNAIVRYVPGFSTPADPSFPSAHSATAFMIAIFLSARYPKMSPFFITMAFLVALSRIYLGFHYPSDVLVGTFLGIFAAFLFIVLGRRKDHLNLWLSEKYRLSKNVP
jgi:undecaprenyl-diphosphatase